MTVMQDMAAMEQQTREAAAHMADQLMVAVAQV
jgi:hypothetical protein